MNSDPRYEGPDERETFADEDPGNVLNGFQSGVLQDLLRLDLSLRGPQGLLESAGHLSRPFPARPVPAYRPPIGGPVPANLPPILDPVPGSEGRSS